MNNLEGRSATLLWETPRDRGTILYNLTYSCKWDQQPITKVRIIYFLKEFFTTILLQNYTIIIHHSMKWLTFSKCQNK